MIHQSPILSRVSNASNQNSCQDSWQKQLQNAFRDPVELLDFLKIPTESVNRSKISSIAFPMLVPQHFAQRMAIGDATDPLLLQVLPVLQELEIHPDYHADPVGDLDSMVIPGLLHKYFGRVLLTLSGACAVHCRYCFRRHFPYSEATITSSNWKLITDYIQQDTTISEVILSGGDPLTLSDRRLHGIIDAIANIKHVTYLRIHSRLPIMIPERITTKLLSLFSSTRLKIIFVVHCNHPNELDQDVALQLQRIASTGCRLLNQSVLLGNINDDAATLADLSHKLFELNIMPYYLHLLDKVAGARHFDISRKKAENIYLQLQNRLPGYLVPRLVQEIPGKESKTPFFN